MESARDTCDRRVAADDFLFSGAWMGKDCGAGAIVLGAGLLGSIFALEACFAVRAGLAGGDWAALAISDSV